MLLRKLVGEGIKRPSVVERSTTFVVVVVVVVGLPMVRFMAAERSAARGVDVVLRGVGVLEAGAIEVLDTPGLVRGDS